MPRITLAIGIPSSVCIHCDMADVQVAGTSVQHVLLVFGKQVMDVGWQRIKSGCSGFTHQANPSFPSPEGRPGPMSAHITRR